MKTKFFKTMCTMLAVMLCVVHFSNAQSTDPVQQKIADQSTVRVGDLGIYKVVDSNTPYSPYDAQSKPQAGTQLSNLGTAVSNPGADDVSATQVSNTQSKNFRSAGFEFANPSLEMANINNETKQITVTLDGLDNFQHEFKTWLSENSENFNKLSGAQQSMYNSGNYKGLYVSYIALTVKTSKSPK